MRRQLSYLLLAGLLFFPMEGKAVVFYSTGDTAYNTTAPAGELAGSGWQYQGTFNQFLGTPVAPHHFITAQHISGAWVPDGTGFVFDGVTYITKSRIHDPDSDLTLWEIEGTFPRYAPLYSQSTEVGRDLVVFGRGWDRGSPVTVNGEVRGWEWGSDTQVQRWGSNVVSGVETVAEGTADESPALRVDFLRDTCMLSGGDSGGGLFVKDDDDVWKLAGVNYTVNPVYFSFDSSFTTYFRATLFDYSYKKPTDPYRLYYADWGYIPYSVKSDADVPCSFYSSRISSRYSWITNNIPDFDQDVDGLPDWWELEYGGDATSMEREGHADSDRFTNYEEWLSDTDPTNGTSFLGITDYSTITNLVFSSSTNREYQVQYRTNLADTNEIWQVETNWFKGLHLQTAQPVSDSPSNRFYRVRAKVR